MERQFELCLGPVLFEWDKAALYGFYEEVESMEVDRVYLGEVVCARKRRFGGLGTKEIEEIASALAKAGKKVVLSTLAVVSNEEELETVRELASLPYALEANDMSLLNMVDPSEREVVAGPHITTYNAPSIDFLAGLGVERVVLPVEMSGESMGFCAAETGATAEAFVHGKAPLAFSWRCYTSRAYGRGKTDCAHDCARYPEGMVIKTTDGVPAFTINGTSVLSPGTYSLAGFIPDLLEKGVTGLRVSPQHEKTARVVEVVREAASGGIDPAEAERELAGLSPGPITNGWYSAGPGRDYVESAVSAAAKETTEA